MYKMEEETGFGSKISLKEWFLIKLCDTILCVCFKFLTIVIIWKEIVVEIIYLDFKWQNKMRNIWMCIYFLHDKIEFQLIL